MEKELSSELKYSLALVNGKLVLALTLDSKGVDSKVEVALDSDYFFDKLEQAIPGDWDKALIAIAKAAAKSTTI